MTRDGGEEGPGLITLATYRHHPHILGENRIVGQFESHVGACVTEKIREQKVMGNLTVFQLCNVRFC